MSRPIDLSKLPDNLYTAYSLYKAKEETIIKWLQDHSKHTSYKANQPITVLNILQPVKALVEARKPIQVESEMVRYLEDIIILREKVGRYYNINTDSTNKEITSSNERHKHVIVSLRVALDYLKLSISNTSVINGKLKENVPIQSSLERSLKVMSIDEEDLSLNENDKQSLPQDPLDHVSGSATKLIQNATKYSYEDIQRDQYEVALSFFLQELKTISDTLLLNVINVATTRQTLFGFLVLAENAVAEIRAYERELNNRFAETVPKAKLEQWQAVICQGMHDEDDSGVIRSILDAHKSLDHVLDIWFHPSNRRLVRQEDFDGTFRQICEQVTGQDPGSGVLFSDWFRPGREHRERIERNVVIVTLLMHLRERRGSQPTDSHSRNWQGAKMVANEIADAKAKRRKRISISFAFALRLEALTRILLVDYRASIVECIRNTLSMVVVNMKLLLHMAHNRIAEAFKLVYVSSVSDDVDPESLMDKLKFMIGELDKDAEENWFLLLPINNLSYVVSDMDDYMTLIMMALMRSGAITGLFHLHNMCIAEGKTSTRWVDADYLIRHCGEYAFFRGEAPKKEKGLSSYADRFLYVTGFKPVTSKKHMLQGHRPKYCENRADDWVCARAIPLYRLTVARLKDETQIQHPFTRTWNALLDPSRLSEAFLNDESNCGSLVTQTGIRTSNTGIIQSSSERKSAREHQLPLSQQLILASRAVREETTMFAFNFVEIMLRTPSLIDGLIKAHPEQHAILALLDSDLAGQVCSTTAQMLHVVFGMAKAASEVESSNSASSAEAKSILDSKFKVVVHEFDSWLAKYGKVGSHKLPHPAGRHLTLLPKSLQKFMREISVKSGIPRGIFHEVQLEGLAWVRYVDEEATKSRNKQTLEDDMRAMAHTFLLEVLNGTLWPGFKR